MTTIVTPPDLDQDPAQLPVEPPAASQDPAGLTSLVLACHDLRKRFGDRTAVDGVGFEIRAGETYGLLGPNGAGKTTTISMICGILPADGGEVHVAGVKVDTGTVAAKGAKRPHSQLRAVLLPFQRLQVSLGRLAADWAAAPVTPSEPGESRGLSGEIPPIATPSLRRNDKSREAK